MGTIPVLVENKVTAREGADWNRKLVMKTVIKQGTKGGTKKETRTG